MQRRWFLDWSARAALALSWARLARAEPAQATSALIEVDLKLAGDPTLARRALVLVPTAAKPRSARGLILLHGLGETGHELKGIRAWTDRYGLVDAYQRLLNPPVQRALEKVRYVEDEWLASLNRRLAHQPFRGMVLICPVTPNPHQGAASVVLDRYSDWIAQVLIPGVAKAVPAFEPRHGLGIDGCSLGGYVATEVFLRRPQLFQSFGTVQSAIGKWRNADYAKRFAQAAKTGNLPELRFLTSSHDPYRGANEALSQALSDKGIDNKLEVLPGPHNQPWLREAGSVAVLDWHDRHLKPHGGGPRKAGGETSRRSSQRPGPGNP